MFRGRFLVVALLLSAVAAGAHAQTGASTTPPPSEYERTIREALSEASAQHWPEARALFERAHALSPSARTLRGLGISAFELRHYVQAVRELEAALVDARNPLTAAQRSEVQQAAVKARRYVGTVKVQVWPAQAVLLLDGVETADRELLLDVGDYRLTARAEGYRDADHELRVAGGQTQTVTLELSRPELSSVAATGTSAPARATSAAPPPARTGGDASVLQRWWFWTAIGVVAVGGTVGAIVLTQGNDDEPERGIGGRVAVLMVAP